MMIVVVVVVVVGIDDDDDAVMNKRWVKTLCAIFCNILRALRIAHTFMPVLAQFTQLGACRDFPKVKVVAYE